MSGEGRAILFLHEKGYDFFSIPRLTYSEIDYLITASNAVADRAAASNRREV